MEKLLQGLSQLTELGSINDIEPIAHGLSQPCFKLNTDKGEVLAKHLGGNSTSATERLCASVAADNGLSPEVVFSNEHWLIQRYIAGHNLQQAPLSYQQKILCAMNLLSSLHGVSVHADIPVLDIAAVLQSLSKRYRDDAQCFPVLVEIAGQLAESIDVEPKVLCHGDLGFANILFNHQAWLVDFECSCVADAEFDMAMFIAINQLPASQLPFFMHLYQHNPETRQRLRTELVTRYIPFCYLINALWFFEQAELQRQPGYRELAGLQLKSFDDCGFSRHSLASLMR